MASNRIKNLVIDIETLNDQIAEAIQIAIENISIDNLGEDGTTAFDIENVEVVFIDGQFMANIDLQRTEGKFVSNQEIEDAVIQEIGNQKITVDVEILA
jgi:hypothetical protein